MAAGEILKTRELPKHSDQSMDTFGRPQCLGLSAAGLEKTECSRLRMSLELRIRFVPHRP